MVEKNKLNDKIEKVTILCPDCELPVVSAIKIENDFTIYQCAYCNLFFRIDKIHVDIEKTTD